MSRVKDLMIEATEAALLRLSLQSGYDYGYLANMWWDEYLPSALEDGEDVSEQWRTFEAIAMEADL